MSKNRQPQRTPFLSVHPNPIYIEDQSTNNNHKYTHSLTTLTRLPEFQPDNKITQLLYSKFIVKGVKPINQEAIMSKLKKSNVNNHRKATRETTNYTKDNIVRSTSKKNLRTKEQSCDRSEDKIFDFSMENCLRKSISVHGIRTIGQEQDYRFQRSMSSKNVRRPQTAIQKSASAKTLLRPQSAYSGQNLQRSTSIARPQTALSRSSSNKKTQSRYYQYESNEVKPSILKISQSTPKLICVDYIEKNKREASSKKKSVYLTAPQNISQSKVNIEKMKGKLESKSIDDILITHKQQLSEQEKKTISQKQRQYLQYMKQSMPGQYLECISYLSKLSEDYQEQPHSLLSLSIGEEQPLTLTSKEIQEHQVKQFYHNFLNKCIDIEYAIKKTERRKPKEEQSQTILNIYQTQTLLTLYNKLKKLKEQCLVYDNINEQIKKLVKNLSFFRNVKPQMFKKVFEMDYQLREVDQNQTIIQSSSQIKTIYIILNGSVTKKNQKPIDSQQQISIDKLQPPLFLNTLFDGQVFGLGNKATDKVLTYSIRTAQKCLLMLLPYSQYRLALRSNESIQDMINLLKQIFPNTSNRFKLNHEDYESLAFQMQTKNYSALQLIVRQNEPFENLIIVAHGSLNICFESVIKRKKQKQYNQRKRKSSLRKEIKIEQLRRNNLYNYELLCEDEQHMQFYYCQKVEQKIRGDIINCRGFDYAITQQQPQSPYKISYSLMSSQDITKLYVLSPPQFDSLPDHLKEVIKMKIQTEKGPKKEVIRRNQAQFSKWQNYKLKICDQILKQKQSKLC